MTNAFAETLWRSHLFVWHSRYRHQNLLSLTSQCHWTSTLIWFLFLTDLVWFVERSDLVECLRIWIDVNLWTIPFELNWFSINFRQFCVLVGLLDMLHLYIPQCSFLEVDVLFPYTKLNQYRHVPLLSPIWLHDHGTKSFSPIVRSPCIKIDKLRISNKFSAVSIKEKSNNVLISPKLWFWHGIKFLSYWGQDELWISLSSTKVPDHYVGLQVKHLIILRSIQFPAKFHDDFLKHPQVAICRLWWSSLVVCSWISFLLWFPATPELLVMLLWTVSCLQFHAAPSTFVCSFPRLLWQTLNPSAGSAGLWQHLDQRKRIVFFRLAEINHTDFGFATASSSSFSLVEISSILWSLFPLNENGCEKA